MQEHVFVAFDAEHISGGRTIFENQWEGALLFSPGQITPQCHSKQFRQQNNHGYSSCSCGTHQKMTPHCQNLFRTQAVHAIQFFKWK